METAIYRNNFELETSHWWFQGRTAIVMGLLDRYCDISPGETAIDIGCGTGMILQQLNQRYRAIGIDTSPLAVDFAKQRGNQEVFCTSLEEAANKDWQPRVALMLDVVEHIRDDASFLRQVWEVLPEGGQVLITVPAYQWLWSAHDVMHHHFRRYRAEQMRELLTQTGFELQKLSYFNTLLFLPALLQKLSQRNREPSPQDSIPTVPSWMNAILQSIFAFERFLLPWFDFPFGISIVAIAQKKRPI
ncbi:bifunctional 2-polyprenyl-6-hydroxyphenol methylase/3-demethylubiquinol 3-O-methyltransferase UbiG [Synechococcus sp. PCC 7336]|uniref:class I SAM-dependent methyltransferase n=1 Tax=Synechococcus sp. PCC 7336 TaxID=195250 RepID=UPI00034D6435|nr:class I SAM-dependent methyltransferase [Synechococcus sp. PCC 7336]